MEPKRRLLIAIALLLLPWVIAVDPDPLNPYYFCAALVASMICFYAGVSIQRVIRFFKSPTSLRNRLGVGFVIVFVASLLILEWPGWLSSDDVRIARRIGRFDGTAGWSFFYSLIASSILILARGWAFMTSLLYFTVFLNLVVLLLSDFDDSNVRRRFFWPMLIILIAPPTYILVVFQNRDSLFTLLFIFLIVALYQQSKVELRKLVQPSEILACAVVLGCLRQEGIIIAASAPFLLYHFRRNRLRPDRNTLWRYVASTAAGLAVVIGVGKIFQRTDFEPGYLLTTIANPLGYIIHEKGLGSFEAGQREKLQKVVRLDLFEKHYSPYEILAVHQGAFRRGSSADDFRTFVSVSAEIFWNNLDLLLANRWIMFLRMTNISSGGYFASDELASAHTLQSDGTRHIVRLPTRGPASGLQRWHMERFYHFLYHLPDAMRLIFASALIPLLALAILVIRFRHYQVLSCLAALLLCRFFIVAVLSPAAQFKYISSVWLGGWILLVYFIEEKFRRV